MLVGIDIDDVKADFAPAFFKHYNEQHGTNYSAADLKNPDYGTLIGGDRENVKKALDEFYESKAFQQMQPIPEAQECIPLLAQKHTLVVISARAEKIQEYTREWINKNFPNCFSDIHFTTAKGTKKADLCIKLCVDVFIEDNPVYAGECAAAGIKVLLFDKPWNQGAMPDGVRRVHRWQEVVDILNT